MKDETKCLRAGYRAKNGEPRVVPICQSTTYRYDTTDQIAGLFNMPVLHMYSRFSNPTCDAVEKILASLEGGVGAMLTSSGQAASLISILNICSAGDSFVCASKIYGGTINLFAVTLKRLGIECIFVDQDASEEEILAKFKPRTRLVFGESLANPALSVLDIEKFASVAHKKGVPLIIDNTFPTPVLCKPFLYGADIVIHSTTKYLDGHAVQGGGVIIDSGKFDWTNGNFPEMTEPDESYHGVVYTREFGNLAYIIKARMQLMRDLGCYPAAHSAFLLNMGIETLPLRMKQYCVNATAVAKYFQKNEKILEVRYPALEGDPYNKLAKKYLPDGSSGVISIVVRGGRDNAAKFMDGLKMVYNEVHVADICSCVLHPASETHRQLTDSQLEAAGINPGLIRFSTGLENVGDIIDDVDQALKQIK